MSLEESKAGVVDDVVRLNRVLAQEGVLDAFGHVSLRDPARPDCFLLSRSCAPELVGPEDVLAFDLAGNPLEPTTAPLYSERVIHSAIYAARPDVRAICHHHAPAILPFCLTTVELRPVTQLGAVLGRTVPSWDSRDAFGATDHLVTTPEQGGDLARALGGANLVLMKRHGATVVAGSAAELAFRTVYGCRNAETQYRALMAGEIDSFTEEEIELASRFRSTTIDRAWGLWCRRLEQSPV